MRRFLITSFLALALVVGAAGVAPTAYAADCTVVDQACTPPGGGTGTCVNDDSGGLTCTSAIGTTITIDSATAKTVVDNKTTTDEAYNGIMSRIMSLFAWLVGIAAITLDNAVYYTVVTMGAYVNNLSAIGVTWSILRDIGNIMLIFGFLAVGITTILNVNWYGGGKKMLPMMFVAAVFLNFSLFITEAVIDTGNLFATQFYTQINGGNAAGAKSFDLDSVSREGISSKIMGQLGLQTIYGNAITNKEIFKGGNIWFIGFMGIILFIITAFVMFSLAFILIARFVILIFLIILAPVGFAGLAVPQLAGTAKKWWDKLFEQTITAPVLLLMLYIALTIITDVRFLTGFGADPNGPQWLGFITGGNLNDFASMMLSFLVAMGLLLAVVIFSKNLSAFGAGWASKTAGKLTFGATAFGLRSSAGWGFQAASQAIRGSRFKSTKLGRVAATTFDKGAKANFDIRGVTAFGGLKATGIDAGETQKGGYRARQEATIKGHEEYIKSVEKVIEEGGVERIIGAQVSRAAAEREKTAAENKRDTTAKEVARQKEEVTRLEEEKKRDKYWGTNPENVRKMEAAQQKVATSEANLATANTRLTQAIDKLSDAEKAEKNVNAGISSEKKAAKVAYAENIQGSLAGWAMFGPGGSKVAKQMIKDATKKQTEAEKALETLKKAVEGDVKESKTETPPAAPSPAPGEGH
jgi:hypothetical protein